MEHRIDEIREEAIELFDRIGLCDCNYSDIITHVSGEYYNSENLTWGYDYGATRLVIWNLNSDYVFKIDCRESELYKYDEEKRKVVALPYEEDTSIGSTAYEYKVYTEAVKRGVSECFTWEEYICDYTFNDGSIVKVYASEFVRIDYDSNYDASQEAAFQTYRHDNGYEDTEEIREQFSNEQWLYDSDVDAMCDLAQMEWTYEQWAKVSKIIRDFSINDLHAGNWGRRKDGMLVISDYAGF